MSLLFLTRVFGHPETYQLGKRKGDILERGFGSYETKTVTVQRTHETGSLNGRILKQYESKQMDRLCSISCERFVMAGYLHRL
jgi:hypothetical protein